MSDSKKENLFKNLARRNESSVTEAVTNDASEPPASDAVEDQALPSPAPAEVPPSSTPTRRGSPKKKEAVKGKREHKDYVQANAYIPKTVRKAVEEELIDLDGMDYSTLVEDLLREWLKTRGVSA